MHVATMKAMHAFRTIEYTDKRALMVIEKGHWGSGCPACGTKVTGNAAIETRRRTAQLISHFHVRQNPVLALASVLEIFSEGTTCVVTCCFVMEVDDGVATENPGSEGDTSWPPGVVVW